MSGWWLTGTAAVGAFVAALSVAPSAAAAAPADAPLDQPDLDAASRVVVVADGQTLAHEPYGGAPPLLLLLLATTARLAPGVVVAVSAPLAAGGGAGLGNLTLGALYAQPVDAATTVGVGAAWTAPTAIFAHAGRIAHAMPREAYRYFEDGSVAQLHGDARWRRGALAVQGQLGLEHYLVTDWRDQTLVRAALAITLRGRLAVGTLEGTLLTDALDEEYDEGHDVVGATSLGVRVPISGGALGVHVTYQRSYEVWSTGGQQWQFGFDASFPVRWW